MASIARIHTSSILQRAASKIPTHAASGFAHRIVKYEPGLLLIKQGLSSEIQTQLAKIALERGDNPDPKKGFWTHDKEGNRILNSRSYRGRIYDAIDQLPPLVFELCLNFLHQAAETDSSLQVNKPTHFILLFYKTLQEPREAYIPWHRDNGENDGDDTSPVVSFSIGDSCDFLVNKEKPKISKQHPSSDPKNLAHRILFESGDVMVFGGPCRNIWHAIYEMHPRTAPSYLPFQEGRLNFTFRFTPNLIGKESRYATVAADQLSKDNQFYQLSKM